MCEHGARRQDFETRTGFAATALTKVGISNRSANDPTDPSPRRSEIYAGLPPTLRNSLAGNKKTTGAPEGEFKDELTGNHITVNYDRVNREVVIAFNGTEDDTTTLGAVGNYLGQVPPSVKQACKLGAAVRESVRRYNEQHESDANFKPIEVVSVGHSRGGMMARAEALKNGGRAVTMNPEPLGFAVRLCRGAQHQPGQARNADYQPQRQK